MRYRSYTGQFPHASGPTPAKPLGVHTPLGDFVLQRGARAGSGRQCVIDRTARAVALLRFAENELKRQAEAGAGDDYKRRVAKILRDVRAIMGELDPLSPSSTD